MTTRSLRKVVFLDTNVLHYVGLYLSRAKADNLFPFHGDDATAVKELNGVADNVLKKGLQKGLRVVKSVKHDNPRVEYSTVSELELLAGRARGKAIEKAAAERIPDRMWSRLGEKDIRERLLANELRQIATSVDDLGEIFREAGIDATVSSSDRGRDVLAIAKEVMSLDYVSVTDSLIYAEAVVAQADQFISGDEYLRKTVKAIKEDGLPSGRGGQLRQYVAAVLSRDLRSVVLPNAEPLPAK